MRYHDRARVVDLDSEQTLSRRQRTGIMFDGWQNGRVTPLCGDAPDFFPPGSGSHAGMLFAACVSAGTLHIPTAPGIG